jgi:hypothetical protein
MTRYRSKPVEIEAFQWFHPGLVGYVRPRWFELEILAGRAIYDDGGNFYILHTANGPVIAVSGDWIIREPSGVGCYPCKAEVFAAKYELIPEPNPHDGWIMWSGGECPVGTDAYVDFWRRSGEVVLGVSHPEAFNWGRYNKPIDTDIIAYRLSDWMQQA